MGYQQHGRIVAITGGARGIGRATAEAFAAGGARVAIGDIDADSAGTTATELADRYGVTVTGYGVNVADGISFAAFLDAAERDLGELDVLVNNAGIMPTGPFLEESVEMTGRVLDINIGGALIGSKLAGTRFAQRGRGHIVNLASIYGLLVSPGLASYCASKHALVGFGEALQLELARHGVHVTTIAPVAIRTELIAGLPVSRFVERTAVGTPEEVAADIVDAVARGRGGVHVSPKRCAPMIRATAALPQSLRAKLSRLLDPGETPMHPDTEARAGYLKRISRP